VGNKYAKGTETHAGQKHVMRDKTPLTNHARGLERRRENNMKVSSFIFIGAKMQTVGINFSICGFVKRPKGDPHLLYNLSI
jgi:hypothetical protein